MAVWYASVEMPAAPSYSSPFNAAASASFAASSSASLLSYRLCAARLLPDQISNREEKKRGGAQSPRE